MTNQQPYLAIGVPTLVNLVGLMTAVFWQTKRFEDLRDMLQAEIAALRAELGGKIDTLSLRVKALEDQAQHPLLKR